MPNVLPRCSLSILISAVLVALASAVPVTAQTVSGQAKAVQTSVVDPLGGTTTTVLADTGPLIGPADARHASDQTGSVTSVLGANTLHAAAISWPDLVRSEASVAALSVTIAGTAVGADFVMARASAVRGLAGTAMVNVDGLVINGSSVVVSGDPNQTVTIPGGQVVINEQPPGSMGTVVNALHIALTGVADVIVASATARVQ